MRAVSRFIDGHPLLVSSLGRRGKGALRGLFFKGTNPLHEDSTLMT